MMTMYKSKFKHDEYLQQQNIVRELCYSLGLKEVKNGYEIQFWTPGHPRIFGECIRLFDYISHPVDRVVFFYGLSEYDSTDHSYCFHNNITEIKKHFGIECDNNHFSFPLCEKDLDSLTRIIKENIEDAKRVSQILLFKEISKDFK